MGPEGSAGTPAVPVGGQPPVGVAGAGQGGTTPGAGGVDMGVAGLLGVAGISAGGSVGTGGNMNPPQSVVPTVTGTEYSLVLPSATLVADGPTGRITQLVVSGTNRLTTAAVNPLNYGSSFWTSPQSVWGWPPPLDAVTEGVLRTDYTHAIDGDAILLSTGATTQGSESVSISKRLSADAARDVLVLEYTITNTGAAAISVAPWEVTRMVAQGFTLYPTGTSAMAPQIPTSAIDGVTWLDYAAAGISPQTKNIADGAEGWLAHVNDGVLFLKVFADSPATAAAPAEGEIELYIDSLSTYVELEQQGAYGSLSAGASSAPWQVLWVVRAVPAEVDVSLGSATLVAWIRDIVAGL